MNLNEFSASTEPLDMTRSDELKSLLQSAADLAIPHAQSVRYQSANLVLRRHRFHYLEWGELDAPPMLLLHGGHQSAHSWDLVSLHLAERYRVLALDQRGHGDSEWARDCDYSTQTMALDAAAFIAALGLERPIVMGHSMGGRNTLSLALANPGLCRALVVVDVGPEISDQGRKAISSFVKANQEFDDLEDFVSNVRKYDPFRSREHIERTVKYNLFERIDGKYVSKCDPNPRRLAFTQGHPEDITLEAMRSIETPVLIVRGEESNILAPDAAKRFVDVLPRGQLVSVPRCGHNVHSQNTLGFIEGIRDFLAAVR